MFEYISMLLGARVRGQKVQQADPPPAPAGGPPVPAEPPEVDNQGNEQVILKIFQPSWSF